MPPAECPETGNHSVWQVAGLLYAERFLCDMQDIDKLAILMKSWRECGYFQANPSNLCAQVVSDLIQSLIPDDNSYVQDVLERLEMSLLLIADQVCVVEDATLSPPSRHIDMAKFSNSILESLGETLNSQTRQVCVRLSSSTA